MEGPDADGASVLGNVDVRAADLHLTLKTVECQAQPELAVFQGDASHFPVARERVFHRRLQQGFHGKGGAFFPEVLPDVHASSRFRGTRAQAATVPGSGGWSHAAVNGVNACGA